MRLAAMILAAVVGMAAVGMAQTEPPKPGPELKKLEVFVGSWTLDGNMKPGMMGPGGSMTENEKCEWMEGGFYLVCHTEFKSSMGNGSGLSVMGYAPEDKAYTYRAFDSFGDFEDARGRVDGDTWKWASEQKMGGVNLKTRFTIKVTSSTSYTFAYETSEDGAKWTTVMDGKASKK